MYTRGGGNEGGGGGVFQGQIGEGNYPTIGTYIIILLLLHDIDIIVDT